MLNSNPYDSRFLSQDIAAALRDPNAAIILERLNYWLHKDVGVVIDNIRWVYNSFEAWARDQFKWLSPWQVRKAMGKLRSLGIVRVERHKSKQWNQTNYYTIDYDRLDEFLQSKNAESTENSDLCFSTSQDDSIPQLKVSESHKSIYRTKNTSKDLTAKQVAAAPTQNKLLEPPKTKKWTKTPESELNLVTSQNKHELEAKKKIDPVDKKPPRVEQKVNKKKVEQKVYREIEQKINNKKWKSHLEELDKLGVQINKTVKNMVKLHSTKQVEGAIALFKARKREKHIANPAGYFVQALKENWASKTIIATNSSKEETVDTQAIFRYWYDLGRELGYCRGQEVRDGEQWVNLSGCWEKWSEAVNRGYTLEYLKGVWHRQKNP